MLKTDQIHTTSKDDIVEKEIKEIKRFLIKYASKVVFFILLIIVLVSAVAYYFWKYEVFLSKLQLAILIGISTFIYLLYYYLRPVFFNFEVPDGVELTNDTPLFDVVSKLVEKINTPKIEKIFLVSDLNASVSSYRTWRSPVKTHYLSIGIQLLATLSASEIKSIIAHELGHISKDHANFSNFIYRLYIGLHHFECDYFENGGSQEALESSSYMKFYNKLDSLSYNVKRNNEFQADEIAAKTTSPDTTASALCRTYYINEWIEKEYWNEIWKNSWKFSTPPKNIIIKACKKIMHCSTQDLHGHFDKVKIARTKKRDTHPSLKDRVEHLKVELKLPNKIKKQDLAINLLGAKVNHYLTKCDEYWQKEILHQWQHYHEYISSCMMRRDLLLKTKSIRPILNGEYLELARLEEVVNNKKTALKRYYEAYQNNKNNIEALFNVTRLMLDTNSVKAETILNKIMNKNPYFLYKGAELLANYYDKINNTEKTKYYEDIIDKADKIMEIRYNTNKTRVLPHGLSANELKDVVDWIKHFGGIYWAMLFQLKPMTGGMPEVPNYILIVSSENYLYGDDSQRLMDGFHLNGTLQLIEEEDDEDDMISLVYDNYKESVIFGELE